MLPGHSHEGQQGRARCRVRYEVIATHHPALESFILSRWRHKWTAHIHAWLWEHVLGDGTLWPFAVVREMSDV